MIWIKWSRYFVFIGKSGSQFQRCGLKGQWQSLSKCFRALCIWQFIASEWAENFQHFLDSQTDLKVSTASEVVSIMYKNDLHLVLPTFWKEATIFSAIPATSCSAEWSFSGLRRTTTYLRSTMGPQRLMDVSIINIERGNMNAVVKNQMTEIIDIFGRRKNRHHLFFWQYSYVHEYTIPFYPFKIQSIILAAHFINFSYIHFRAKGLAPQS